MSRPGFKKCPYCAEEIREEAIKCRYCQSMLADGPGTPQPISPVPPEEQPDWEKLKRFLPARVVESILQGSQTVEEGERRKITIIFADLTDFTSLAEEMDAEDVKLLMDDCFEIMGQSVHQYGGVVDKYLGDAIMALFGAPQAFEDDPERAIRAAAEMLTSIRKLGKERGVRLELSIGVSTGNVVVGGLGGTRHLEYTAIGDSVNLASRLESVAKPGQILISEATYRSVRDIFRCAPLGPVQIKGKRKPVEVYEVTQVGSSTFQDARLSRTAISPFVGRDVDLNKLIQWARAAENGESQFVHLTGEAGVGKSRMLLELRSSLQQESFEWHQARSVSYGEHFPYHPLIHFLQVYCDVQDTDGAETVREKLRRQFETQLLDWTSICEVSEYLLGLKLGSESKLLEFPSRERQDIVFRTLTDLFIKIAERKTLVLVFEDLHWADRTTLEFIDELLPALVGHPVVVFLVYRPYFLHEWKQGVPYRYIELKELSTRQSEDLLEAILGIEGLEPSVREEILAKSEGNPFYVEEMVRILVDCGVLEYKDGQYRLIGDISEVPIPETVEGIILARIDRLSVQIKQVLQCASVIGVEFRYRLLKYISKVQEKLKYYLTQLSGLELVYEKSVLPELEYLFKHVLTQEVTYRTLLNRRRKDYHGRIALCLEELYSDRLEEHFELLAHHFVHSNYTDKAVEYCWKAGEKSRRLFANESALEFYSKRLELMPDPPQTEEESRERIQTLLARADVELLTGKTGDADEDLETAQTLADNLNDRTLQADISFAKGNLARFTGQFETARLYFDSALGDYQALPSVDGEWKVRCAMGVVEWACGRFQEARKDFEEILARQEPPLGLWDRAHNWNNLGLVLWNMGHYEEAADALARSLEYRHELGDLKGSVAGLNNLGIVFERLGRFSEARERYLEAVRTATEIGHAQAEAASRVNLGQLYALQGRYQQAREHYDQALQLARRGQDAHCEAMVLGNIGLVCLAQNRVEEAGDWLNQAHSLARKTGDHDSLMNAERGLAELELSRNNPASARTLLEAAIHASEGRAHGDTIIPFRRLLARSCRLLGDIEIAKRLALDTLQLARSAGYRTEEMWSLLELVLQNPPERRENSPEFREAIDIARSLEIESLLRSAARQ